MIVFLFFCLSYLLVQSGCGEYVHSSQGACAARGGLYRQEQRWEIEPHQHGLQPQGQAGYIGNSTDRGEGDMYAHDIYMPLIILQTRSTVGNTAMSLLASYLYYLRLSFPQIRIIYFPCLSPFASDIGEIDCSAWCLESFLGCVCGVGAGLYIEDTREDTTVQLLSHERQHGTRFLSRRHARLRICQGNVM